MRPALLAIPALLIARLLPEHGVGLYLRLAAATGVALLPGLYAARALGAAGLSGTLVWSLAGLTAALAAAVLLHTGFWLVVLLYALFGLGVLALRTRWRGRGEFDSGAWALAAAGVLLGIALWQVAGGIEGDALFHLGRVRKLVELDSLSLTGLGEFADGGLHPGYAFPLWHAFLGLVATLAGVDPSAVALHESSVLAPVALVVAYEAGAALFRSRWLGAAVAAAQVAMIAFAPGSGGAYRVLELPATASRQLLVPAALALFFRGRTASVAAAALGLALVHATYALFLLVPLCGYVAARWLLVRRDVRELAKDVAAFLVPSFVVAAALYPVARQTASQTPSEETLAGAQHGLGRYAGQLDVFADGGYRLAPEVFGRTGAVAVAALLLVPLAALAARRRWAAFVLGGSLSVLALMLVPLLFETLADLVSLSQARRAAGFLPFAFAFAGGAAVLARLLGPLVLPLALGAGIALQLAFPGDFGYMLEEGGPAPATWFAALGGLAALVAATALRPAALARPGALAAAAAGIFVAPVAVHAAFDWEERAPARPPLPAGLVEFLRDDVAERDVVLADVETSYRILAEAAVYVVAAPPSHVADTDKNRPFRRQRTVRRFLRTGDLAIARQAKAGWLVIDRRHFDTRLDLAPVRRFGRYEVFRLA